jgi:pimeloyl-ACP methyl ester carboxylesterase
LAGARVFTPDLPGHGKSAGPGLQTVEDYSRRILEFMDAVRLSRAVLAGHDLGGAAALAFALDRPDRASGIVLISSGARLPIASTLLENAANASTLPLAIRALYDSMVGPHMVEPLAQGLHASLASARQAMIHGDLMACDRFDVIQRLDSVRTPTLVICGTDDKLAPVRFSELLASGIPGAALQTVDGAGHQLMLEQPRRLAALLDVFMRTIPFVPGA